MSKEAMKLALEALKQIDEAMPFPVAKLAQAALRKALANEALDKKAENARELGLDYEPPCKTGSQCTNKCQQCEQPAQQQKPVAWVGSLKDPQPHCVTDLKYCSVAQWDTGYHLKYIPLYTSPPASKPWVGLTEKEKLALVEYADEAGLDDMKFIEDIEAKLKEKNT